MKNQDDCRSAAGVSRRAMLAGAAGLVAAAAGVRGAEPKKLKGRINHSVCKWCYGMPLEKLAQHAASIGIKSVELVGPGDWPILKKHRLICAMTPSHGIGRGLTRKENHKGCLDAIRKSIDATAEAGFPNVICFSGNRGGMADDVGLDNCVIALKQIVGYAERKKVTICMELLNSKVNHKDYMCDRTAWGVELCKKVGSENFKLLYDIYHMQIDEGDIIRTIRDNFGYIAHYHTGGVPGRNEIDETQELYYPAIMRAIADKGFKGYVAQEFIPRRKNKLKSLTQAIEICDV